MVGRDGVMHPPVRFPKGGHLLSFLSCLETGLQPYGQLDPPLWSQKGKGITQSKCTNALSNHFHECICSLQVKFFPSYVAKDRYHPLHSAVKAKVTVRRSLAKMWPVITSSESSQCSTNRKLSVSHRNVFISY